MNRIKLGSSLHFLRLITIFFLFLFLLPSIVNAGQVPEKRLLLIFSYNMAYAQHYLLAESFFEEINKKKISYQLSQLELESFQSKSDKDLQASMDLFLPDIRSGKYHLILSFGKPALKLLQENLSKIPKDIPIVFCGVNEYDPKILQQHPNTTGVLEDLDAEANLELGLRLFPKTKRIILLANWTEAGMHVSKQVEAFKQKNPNLEFIFFNNATISTEEMLRIISEQKSNSLLLFHGWYNRNVINFASLQYLMTQLESNRSIPVLVMNNAMLRYGVVGGVMSPSSLSGQYMAEAVSAILSGRDAEDFSITKIQPQTILNGKMLDFHKIQPFFIPATAHIDDSTLPVWFEKRDFFLLAASSLLVVSVLLLIVILFYLQYNRLKEKYNAILSNMPYRIGVVNTAGNILFYHQEYEDATKPKSKLKHLRNFPFPVYEFLKKNINYVFENDYPKIADYRWEGRRRVEFYPILKSVFHQKAVIWVSCDIEHLTRTMEEFKQLYHQTSLVLNTIRDAVIHVDACGYIKSLNPAAIKLTQTKEEDLVGKKISETFILFNEDKQIPLAFPLDEVFQTGSYIYEGGNVLLRTANSDKDSYINYSIAPVTDITSSGKSAVIVIQDISETKKNRKIFLDAKQNFDLSKKEISDKLIRSEMEKYRIIDAVPFPILLFDRHACFQTMNKAATNILKQKSNCIINHSCKQNICGTDEKETICPVIQTSEDRKPHTCDISLDNRDFRISSYPLIENGELTNILVTYSDLTDIHETRLKLANAIESAQKADKAKSFFLASMSHELRTPLNAVLGFCELLQKSELPPETRNEYLHSIQTSGNVLLKLLNDILDLSKIEADQIILEPTPTDLRKLLEEMKEIFAFQSHEKGIAFHLSVPENLPRMELDSSRLRQILLNLIGNALKFTEHGKISVELTLKRLDLKRALIKITVADTGIGIPSDKLPIIFEPFAQHNLVRDTKIYNGTGLGLAIASRMVRRMGGVIAVQSVEGCGTTFTLILKEVVIHREDRMSETAAALRKLLQ